MFLIIEAVNKDFQSKTNNFADNILYNICIPFDVLPNFLFTTSETTHDY